MKRYLFLLCCLLVGCGGGGGGGSASQGGALPTQPTPASQSTQREQNVVLAWDHYDPSIKAILEAAALPQDYINLTVAQSDSVLLQRVGWSHVFQAPANNATPAPGSTPAAGTLANAMAQCPTTATIFYDIEHWTSTPLAQQQNPVAAIMYAMNEISTGTPCAADGFSHFNPGITPDGVFSGWYSCGFNAASTEAFYNQPTWVNTGPGNNWQSIAYYDIQSQTLLSQSPWDQCYGSVQDWWNVVGTITKIAKTGNPSMKVWAHVSLGDESATMMAAAVQFAVQQQTPPDAYVVLYPDNATLPCPNPYAPPTPPPHSWTTRCTFDSPSALQQFAYAMGRATPVP
jgi:hypothetical protein